MTVDRGVSASLGLSAADALLIVDVQNDFCPGGALAVERGSEVVPVINRLLPLFANVVLTQDWHPSNHLSFAATHGARDFDAIYVVYGWQTLWPRHCMQGTDGAAFHPELNTAPARLIVRKGVRREIDSYSAFRENDRKTTTGLAGYLRSLGIRRVFVAGLALDYCVRWSAVDAVEAGFEAVVIEDACRGIGLNGSLEAAYAEFHERGVQLISTERLALLR